MKKPAWYLIAGLLLCSLHGASGQDTRERVYLYPILKPQHENKSLVEGWATQRVREPLDRGLIVQSLSEGIVYMSWRLLEEDPADISFTIYRKTEGKTIKLNKKPITKTTDYLDRNYINGASYSVVPVVNGREVKGSEFVDASGSDGHSSLVFSVPFQGDYRPSKIAVADLNGDGKYDFVIKQPGSSIDPAYPPDTTGTTYKIEAYLNDGTFLWRHDLGLGIEPGIWYSPMVVYDFNGDGKAEVAVKTGPSDAREASGRVLSGPEWCSVFDGMTGKEIARADWPERSWRFGDYNRNNRNQMGMAYLDGKTPCLLVARGTYRLMVVDAYQLNGSDLEQLWHWEGDEENPVVRSQGAHGMHTADVDEDGREEVILGSVVLDDNGTALYSIGLGHPDKCFVTDIDPERPGMEIFFAIEPYHDDGKGVCLADAKTGEIIWEIGHKTWHVGNGMVADIDPTHPGLECFATEDSKGGSSDRYMFTSRGERMGTAEEVPDCTPWVFWDGDLLRETYAMKRPDFKRDEPRPREWWRNFNPEMEVMKYKGDTLVSGLKGRVVMVADIIGDWREELITVENGKLNIYTTTIPAEDRRVCLMQDPVYRAEVAHRSMGYDQSPVTGYYLGTPVKK